MEDRQHLTDIFNDNNKNMNAAMVNKSVEIMSFEQKSCLLCLKEMDDGIEIFGEIGKVLNVWEVIVKYFWFDLLHSFDSYICSECWQKVKSFHEFYLMVEALHNRPSSEIGEESNLVRFDEKEQENLEEQVVELDEHTHPIEEVIELEIDVLNCGTNTDVDRNSDERDEEESHCDETQSFHESELITEAHSNNELELDGEQEAVQIEEIADEKQRYLSRRIIPFQPKASPVPNRKIGRPKLRRNEKNYHNTICPICEDVMKFGSLKSHIELVHQSKPQRKERFACEMCSKVYTSSSEFTKHTWTHMNEDLTRVQCDICSKWLKNKHILRVHKQNHQIALLKCPHCEKIKYNESSLKAHITAAHATRKHQCSHCVKSFSRPIALKEHMAIHTGESLYNCSYCSKPFKSSANMYKHMREVHTEQWNIDRVMRRQK